MYQTCIKTAIYLYIPYKRNLQWLATARCLPLGKQSQNTHFQFSSPRKAWVLESSHHISTSRCLPGGSVVRWKHAKNVWKPMEKSVWKLVCLRSRRYSPDLQTSGSTGSRIVHWGSHHILSLAIKQLKSCNAQLWILQRRSHSMVTFKHISSPIYISTYFSWWPACLTIWIFEVIPHLCSFVLAVMEIKMLANLSEPGLDLLGQSIESGHWYLPKAMAALPCFAWCRCQSRLLPNKARRNCCSPADCHGWMAQVESSCLTHVCTEMSDEVMQKSDRILV